VIGRSQRLRGLYRTFPSYLRGQEEARGKSAARKRKMDAVLSKFRQEIARGVARNEAIAHARKAGATLQAIGEVLGVTRQRVRQILNRQRLREGGELSFKVVRLKKAGQELLARAGNIMVARAAFDVSVSLYQSAEIELRQGSVGLHQRP
jgi:hypothetical protein